MAVATKIPALKLIAPLEPRAPALSKINWPEPLRVHPPVTELFPESLTVPVLVNRTPPPMVMFPETMVAPAPLMVRLPPDFVMPPESVRLPAVLLMPCPAVALPKMIGAEIMLLPAVLLIAALVVLPVPRSVRAVVAFAEESVKLPVVKVMPPVVAFTVRLGLMMLLAWLNVARSVALPPGVDVPFQFPPVLHVVLLVDVHVAFWPWTEAIPPTRATVKTHRMPGAKRSARSAKFSRGLDLCDFMMELCIEARKIIMELCIEARKKVIN